MRSAAQSQMQPSLLLIERDPAARRHLAEELERLEGLPHQLDCAASGREAAERLRQQTADVVIADLASVADLAGSCEMAVARLVRLAQGALVIAISEGMSVSAAVEAMRAGAHDYVAKPIAARVLAARIGELTERHGKRPALTASASSAETDDDFSGFIGCSPQMGLVFEQIARIAPSSAPVFITGESGSGKEVCAEAIHAKGPRAGKPLIAINCGAIPRELMESEIFGVARGAFTGAMEDRKGAAELADGGTLFLDEIGEMDLSLQSKLLRFLQTGTITRVGEGIARPVDVRIVCATNRNPMQMIAERTFREDLFYRLHVLPIHLPPLRQRPADILPLTQHFLRRFSAEEHKHFCRLSPATSQLFMARDWPGNVRQVQNLIRRIVVMFDGEEITSEMVRAADIEAHAVRAQSVASSVQPVRCEPDILPMWQQEQRIIEDALLHFGGNIAQAAAALEISPSTIYRKKQAWEQMNGAA